MSAVLAGHRIATYTDGSEVQEGDLIRYKQAPGGILPASDTWTYGVAAKFPHTEAHIERMLAFNAVQGYVALDPEELYLQREEPMGGYSNDTRTAYSMIVSHIVERAA